MKRFFLIVLCLLLLTGCAGQAMTEGEYSFTDDTGFQVRLDRRPGKVAVLTSSLADLWVTAGGHVDITVYEAVERGFADDEAVLVDDGAGKTVNLELLIASKPDFVLYSCDLAGQRESGELLRAAGIPAAGFRLETFEDYLALLKICTDLLETPQRYGEYGTKLQEKVDKLRLLAQSQPEQPRILFVRAGSNAKYTKAKTADNHFVCVMLKELGSENIAEHAPVLLDGLSLEEILMADPDHILFTTMGEEAAGTAYMESLLRDSVWSELTAVKTGNVHQLPKELFQYKPNSRWDEAYRYLMELLYGDIV